MAMHYSDPIMRPSYRRDALPTPLTTTDQMNQGCPSGTNKARWVRGLTRAPSAAHPAIRCSLVDLVLMKDSRLNRACGKDKRDLDYSILSRLWSWQRDTVTWALVYLGVGVDAGQAFRNLPALEMLQRHHQVEELRRQAKINSWYILPADIGVALQTPQHW